MSPGVGPGSAAPGRPAWVVGAGGLMGSHVVQALGAHGSDVLTRPVAWAAPARADDDLAHGLETLLERSDGGPWDLVWCAGVGVVSTPADALAEEVRRFERLLARLREHSSDLAAGTVLVASSAGGVYAGSTGVPFTEHTAVRATSAYGESKLALEASARALAEETGLRVLITRTSNLYGPGQDLTKPQGLVTALCRAVLTGEPVPITVSMATRRDYLFADDCAVMVAAGLERLREASSGEVVVKILDSGATASIAELLVHAREAFGVSPPVADLHQGQARGQALDLTVRSVVWPDLNDLATTSLVEGFRATMADTSARTGLPVPAPGSP